MHVYSRAITARASLFPLESRFHPVAAGAALATHFETHCPQLPALGAGRLPESEWLLDALSQVHICRECVTLTATH